MVSPLLVSCAGSLLCRVSSPSSSIYVPYQFSKAPWSSSLPVAPTLSVPPSVASDARKSYSRRASAPCSDLAPSAPSDWRGRGPALPSFSTVFVMSGGPYVRCSPIGSSLPPLAPCILVDRAVGGFSSSLPRSCPSRLYCGPLWGFVTLGLLIQSGGVGAMRRLDSPAHSVACAPPYFSATPEASRPPSLSPTLWDSWATLESSRPPIFPCTPKVTPPAFYRRTPFFLPCPGLAP